ncbi:hypothetical protein ACFJIW_17665 [Tahibacter sp. UC22_41]|uniref:hypothetical protein n=1 Tax=Tahibacter sp. UC22_41 TaxID=3350178 RepID=UPI0036D7B415
MRFHWIPALLLTLAALPASAASPSPEVVVVQTRDQALIQRMADRLGHLRVDRKKGTVMAEIEPEDLVWLRTQTADLAIDKDATAALQQQTSGRALKSIPGFSCYRTVEETLSSIDNLIAAHPNLASKIDIGDTWEKVTAGGDPGYDLVVLS